jgi:hypothetical protein
MSAATNILFGSVAADHPDIYAVDAGRDRERHFDGTCLPRVCSAFAACGTNAKLAAGMASGAKSGSQPRATENDVRDSKQYLIALRTYKLIDLFFASGATKFERLSQCAVSA